MSLRAERRAETLQAVQHPPIPSLAHSLLTAAPNWWWCTILSVVGACLDTAQMRYHIYRTPGLAAPSPVRHHPTLPPPLALTGAEAVDGDTDLTAAPHRSSSSSSSSPSSSSYRVPVACLSIAMITVRCVYWGGNGGAAMGRCRAAAANHSKTMRTNQPASQPTNQPPANQQAIRLTDR